MLVVFGTLLLFLVISSAAPFKDKLFSTLFPKPDSKAFTTGFDVTNAAGSPLPNPTADTFTTNSLDVIIKLKDVNGLVEP